MPRKLKAGHIIQDGVETHPAVAAWRRLDPRNPLPSAIEVLKLHKKSEVYRFLDVRSNGSEVVAKRARMKTALLEEKLYTDFLPRLPVPAPAFYGRIEECDPNKAWMFMEDLGNCQYSGSNEDHSRLAARWLGLMHSSSHQLLREADLPPRGPREYLTHLQGGRQRIEKSLADPDLSVDGRVTLISLATQLDQLLEGWGSLTTFCQQLPSCLVHGDFVAKNLYVREQSNSSSLWAIDWEYSGRGNPSPDLGRNLAAVVYCETVRGTWPHFNPDLLFRISRLGQILRIVAAIDWASWNLAYHPDTKVLQYMDSYCRGLRELSESPPWH